MKWFRRILFLSLLACSLFSACATKAEKDIARRDEVEQMMLRGGYLHDGPSELQEIGDIKSVPALLIVLKENPPFKNGTMVCTTAHGLMALRKLTGANPGVTYEECLVGEI